MVNQNYHPPQCANCTNTKITVSFIGKNLSKNLYMSCRFFFFPIYSTTMLTFRTIFVKNRFMYLQFLIVIILRHLVFERSPWFIFISDSVCVLPWIFYLTMGSWVLFWLHVVYLIIYSNS